MPDLYKIPLTKDMMDIVIYTGTEGNFHTGTLLATSERGNVDKKSFYSKKVWKKAEKIEVKDLALYIYMKERGVKFEERLKED